MLEWLGLWGAARHTERVYCLLTCLAFSLPRAALVALFFATDHIEKAFDFFLWPLLGFLFMPLTTLVYAWSVGTTGSLRGIHVLLVVLAFAADVETVRRAPRRAEVEE